MKGGRARQQLGRGLHAREIERHDEPLAALPPPEGWVTPEAAQAWELLGRAAIKAGALCESDLPTLALAASLWALHVRLQSQIAGGQPQAARDAANIAGKLAILLQQLGLTPRARQLIVGTTQKESDEESPFEIAAKLRRNRG